MGTQEKLDTVPGSGPGFPFAPPGERSPGDGAGPHLMIVKRPVRWHRDTPHGGPSSLSTIGLKLKLKSTLDFLGALLLLVLCAPLFLIVALSIKLTSAGPVFFRQQRLGWYQRPFMMWKFRTMTAEAQEQEADLKSLNRAVFFKIREDPRVTQLGSALRRFSLDELPQLFNVLTGEMSLVGPRPIRDFELRKFSKWQELRRFSMKPGLTGLWQVNGRNKTSDEVRMRQDLEYVDSWSFLLDLKLLLKTIPAVVRGDGAV